MQYDENAEKYGYEGEMTPLKCDKLEQVENPIEWGLYYDKSEVDEAIAELKAKLESVQASMYADVVDANMKVRKLRRALYKACANWAHHRVFVRFKTNEKAWENMERKCIKKAEEYK